MRLGPLRTSQPHCRRRKSLAECGFPRPADGYDRSRVDGTGWPEWLYSGGIPSFEADRPGRSRMRAAGGRPSQARPEPMPPKTRDTHPEAERVQLELLRRASAGKRLALARSLSTTAIQLSRRAIARAHPDADPRELKLLFVEYHYGKDLAEAVRARLSGG